MVRAVVGALLLILTAGFNPAARLSAAEPFRFKFQAGQVLLYNVQQTTTIAETTLDDKTARPTTATSTAKLALTRRWEVKAVNPDGTATMEMSITAVRQEFTRPGPADKDGKATADTTIIDSATDEGRKQMADYLNKPIVRVKVDPRGQLAEANALVGSDDRARAETPFRLTLPEQAVEVGGKWDRSGFTLKLDPPAGTGEKFDVAQSHTLKSLADGTAVIGLTTALKSPPGDPALMPALVPMLWEGELYFQPETGRYSGAKLSIEKNIANHQGAGSRFVYESRYVETLEK